MVDKQMKTDFTGPLIALSLSICFWILVLSSPAFSQNDGQDNNTGTPSVTSGTALILQPGVGLRYNLNKKIGLYQDFRTYFNKSNPVKNFEELSFGARYNLGKIKKFHFSTTIGYLLSLDNNYKIHEYRPKIYFTTGYHLKKVGFEFRNRFEYRIKTGENSGSSLRYRPRFKVGLRYNFHQFQLSPYIYNELFFGENGFSQHRIKLALSVKYHDFRFTAGNLFKIKPGQGLVENRVSLDVSYTIPSSKKNK
ncbi:DUF2490 domain-containing protein [bacterium]|nr:DUF2490 domain-containing protein [bacterium]